MDDLDALGFNLVGYGCTTCIGNSGPLADEITDAIQKHKLVVSSILSGNRNFEGRIHQDENELLSVTTPCGCIRNCGSYRYRRLQ